MVGALDIRDPEVAAQVLRLQRAAYAVEAELIGFQGIPPLHETLDELMAAPIAWLGVRSSDRVVAALASVTTGPVCHIHRLVVDPSRHRQGHGRRLLEAVLHHPVLRVSTGERNAPAVALYTSLGFGPVGRREVAPGVWTMQLERGGIDRS